LTSDKNNVIVKEISKGQANFLDYVEEVGWGKIELWRNEEEGLVITINNGEPVLTKQIERTRRHDSGA